MRLFSLLFQILFVCLTVKASAQETELKKKIYTTFLEHAQIDHEKVPSMLILYQSGEEKGTVYIDLNEENEAELLENLPIMLGDLSHAWTVLQIMKLVDRGVLSLEDNINQFLPQRYQQATPVTIEQLLSHRSGLNKIPNNIGEYEGDGTSSFKFYPDTALLEYFREQDLTEKIGDYKYSHIGYAMLQYLLMQNGIAIPKLSMRRNLGFKEGAETEPESYSLFTCAKGIALSPRDLFALIKELKTASKDFPFYPTKLQRKTNVSYGFHVLERKNKEIALLKSASDGFSIMAAFDRDADKIILVIANAQDYVAGLYGACSWFFR